jgi:hypothetical protein
MEEIYWMIVDDSYNGCIVFVCKVQGDIQRDYELVDLRILDPCGKCDSAELCF